MSRGWAWRRVVLSGLAALAFAGSALADNTTCANAIRLVPDGSRYSGSFAAAEDRWFVFSAAAGRSYQIMSDNTAAKDVNDEVFVAGVASDCAATAIAGTQTLNEGAEPVSFDVTPGSHRVAIVSTASQRIYFRVTNNAVAGTYQVRVVETTMFSPAWTSNGNFDTFWSFTNTTGTAISGTLTLLNLAGSTTIATAPISIPANGSVGTNTVSLAVPRNNVGVARFVHNGTPGSVIILATEANFTTTPAYNQVVPFKQVRGDLW